MERFPVKIHGSIRDGIVCDPNHANPDPFALRWKNQYFCYSSGEEGIHVLVSADLKEFQDKGYAYFHQEEYSFWAPVVFYWKGRFYLYYSSLKTGETDDHLHFLRVAVADHPLGPFQWMADLTDYFAIDPHVVAKNDRFYIFYASNIQENTKNGRIGTAIWMDELVTLDKMSGNGRVRLFPTIDEEIFARNRFGDGKDWHTLEGPCYLSDGETSWILYSGNAYTSPDYFIGYAAGKTEDDLWKTEFVKRPAEESYIPLVRSKNGIEGTGHNSVTQAPDHITPVIAYHGRKPGEITDINKDDRKLYLDYIWRNEYELRTDAPTLQGITEFPKPDIQYLNEHEILQKQYKKEKCLKAESYEIEIPKEKTFYLELCAKIPTGEIQLLDGDTEKVLLTLTGDYWQHGGILFEGGQVRCRYGEEWKKPILCEQSEKIKIKVTGQVFLEYLDGTFLQKEGENTPGCLL